MNKIRSLIAATGTAALAGVVLSLGAAPDASGGDLLRNYRKKRLSNVGTMQSVPFVVPDGTPDCGGIAGLPDLLGDVFHPGLFDQIDVAGDSRLIAYATQLQETGIPGAKRIVVLREGAPATSIAEAAGFNDQPQIDFDRFGWRVVFRGGADPDADLGSDIFLHTVTRAFTGGETDEDGNATPRERADTSETINITELDASAIEGNRAFDPTFTARTRVKEFKGDVKVTQRDARVAFISDGDLDLPPGSRPPDPDDPDAEPPVGRNEDFNQQLFLWREQRDGIVQLTDVTDPFAELNRPSMSANGKIIAFECTGDLTPDAANPLDPTQVGNPAGIRQIFIWENRGGDRGRIRQATWSDADCFGPRASANGRSVLFSSRGDLLPGANPEGNSEIFQWRRTRRASRRLAQLTATTEGNSVLPRPLRNRRRFVFYSTASPPGAGLDFGGAAAQCGPTALLWTRGSVRRIAGLTDLENLAIIADTGAPIVVGPPAAGTSPLKIQYATNDPLLDGGEGAGAASLFQYHMARATRFR